MNGLQTSLYTVAVSLCVFSAGVWRDRQTRRGARFDYFTLFLVIESLAFVFELLMAHPAVPLKSLWLGLRMSTSLFVAPCLWLAVRETMEDRRPAFSSLGRNQFFLICLGVAFTLPVIETAHLGVTYPDPNHPVSRPHSVFIHTTMLLCIGIFAWQVPYYLWQCRRLLLAQLAAQRDASSLTTASINRLQLPLVVVFTTWVLGLVRTVQCATHAPAGLGVLFAFIDVSVTVAALYVIVRHSSELETLPPETGTSPVETTQEEPELTAESKYAKSPLDAVIRQRIVRKLESAMVQDRLYRNSLLNLRGLGAALKENTHYVSQVINQDLNSNFYELVNRYRIDEAKKRLVDAPEQTILEIALAVGFNSKSTFNTAFRRLTGQTPSSFRASGAEN